MVPEQNWTPWPSREIDVALWRQELGTAARFQAALTARRSEAFPRVHVYGCCFPTFSVGGDYFEFLKLPHGGLRIILGDAMGKGFTASVIMALVRGAVRGLSPECRSPGELLHRLNSALYEDLQRMECFMTLICLDFDAGAGQLACASAGSPRPMLLRRQASAPSVVPVQGVSLGLMPSRTYVETVVAVESGDVVAITSDGIPDARSPLGAHFGTAGLERELCARRSLPLPEVARGILESVATHSNAAGVQDDVTLVLMRVEA